jgi:hypothetical protein
MARLSVAMAGSGFFSLPAHAATKTLRSEAALVRSTDACRSRFLAELPLEGLAGAAIPADYGLGQHVASPSGASCHVELLPLEHCDLFLTKNGQTMASALTRARAQVSARGPADISGQRLPLP